MSEQSVSLTKINEEVNIRNLISSEIALAEKHLKSRKEVLENLIEAAGSKLEEFIDDETQICTIIQKYFPEELGRDVRRYCPSKYKRKYTPEDSKKNEWSLFTETFQYSIDTLAELQELLIDIVAQRNKILNEQGPQACISFENFVYKAFGGFAEFKEYARKVKEANIDLSKLKQMRDNRNKIDHLSKFMLYIQAFYLSKSKVGKDGAFATISSKWVKKGILNNQKLEELAIRCWQSDEKLHVMSDWFLENKIRLEKDLPILPMPTYKKRMDKKEY